MEDTILIVDDEGAVRQTVREWLTQAELDCSIFAAADAEAALTIANEHTIDLAILDWNLGSGDDGLHLLQDLAAFHPNIVAIMITGFANLATPLDAMRMGVRDYLDKNHDFSRESLTASVRRQLDILRPAKQMRRLHETLAAFQNAVREILPLVQSTAALNDPVPLPEAVRSLVHFLMQLTRARHGLLLVRHYDAERTPPELARVYDASGQVLATEWIPFARSIAGSAVSRGQPCVMNDLQAASTGAVDLQPFEKAHRNLLAVPMTVSTGMHVVLELFDSASGFSAEDQQAARAAADLGTDLLRQALGQRKTDQLLFHAVEAALKASEKMLAGNPPPPVLDQLRAGLCASREDVGASETSVRLAEAIRVLANKHGQPALEHCLLLVDQVRLLLDRTLSEGS